MQTWKDNIHLAKEKSLSELYQNVISLPLSGEKETGAAGEQLVNDNLTDWNGQGGLKPSIVIFVLFIIIMPSTLMNRYFIFCICIDYSIFLSYSLRCLTIGSN